MNNKSSSTQLNATAERVGLVFGIFLIITLVTLMILLLVWFYTSQIKRNNSRGYNGHDMSKHIFKKMKVKVKVKKTFFYVKFWNYNKRSKVHKLRPWTYRRKSTWSLMEASKQAYVTSASINKSKELWKLFWIPLIIKIAGYILCLILLSSSQYDYSHISQKGNTNWVLVGVAVGVVFGSHAISDLIRTITIWKGVTPLMVSVKLTKREMRSIHLMFFVRSLFSIAGYFIDNNKLILKIVFWIWDVLKSLFKNK